ncbi:MAG: toll/interleukin-1 receptor domain-containing protein [Methylococcaceae bacterium]|nr:toll/interleukin-1 receptor domain-containing protein [Methylococcaceae bacterium]
MTTHNLQELDWQKLLKNIERGKCVLMLGPDIPAQSGDQPEASLTTLLAQHLAAKVREKKPDAKLCDDRDLPHVAQNYLAYRVGDRIDLECSTEAFYQTYQQHTTPLHQCLAQLPFSYCLSISPDNLMQTALNQTKDKHARTDFYHFKSGNKSLDGKPNPQAPLLYKLYGCISATDSLILAETDLLDFLANIIANTPELPPLLGQLLSDKDTTFLFIGFGFQRWYLRILLHVLRKQQQHRLGSLALEAPTFFNHPEHPQTVFYYDHAHTIEFKSCAWHEFAQDLLRRYQHTQNQLPDSPPSSPSPDAPLVFLCHSSKNQAEVAKLAGQLRQLGLNVWRDRDNLHAGEVWDNRIQHVIDKQIQYFLVLQTPDMLAPAESYFIREIKRALARQQGIDDDYVFIIPAWFGGTSEQKLSALAHLNYFDLRTQHDLSTLLDHIQHDQTQRKLRQDTAHD